LKEVFLASPRGEGPEGCPEPTLFWRGARGELPREELGSLVDHVAGCEHCTEIWRLAREMAASTEALEGARPTVERAGRSWMRWGALAFSAALVLTAGITVLQLGTREPVSSYREAAEGEIHSLLPESLALPRSACLLRWTDLGEGAHYEVSVATVELEPLFSATALEIPELLVPESALADLPPGATILWQVEASLGEGRRAVSGTFAQLIE
jgi:hypothetical protein